MQNLEELVIKVDANTKSAEDAFKKLNEATEKAASSLNKVGQNAHQSSNLLIGLANHLKTYLAAYGVAALAISKAVSTFHQTQEIGELSQSIRVNVTDLDLWGRAAKTAGGNANTIADAISGVSEKYGVSTQNALKLFPQLAKGLKGLSDTAALNVGKQMGLNEPTIRLLQRGNKEVLALVENQKKYGFITKEDVELTQKFNQSMNQFGDIANHIARQQESEFLPILTKVYDLFSEFGIYLAAHPDLVKGFLLFAGAAAVLAAGLAIVVSPLALGAAAFASLGAAIAIAYEDFMAFRNGLPSLIGDIINALDKFSIPEAFLKLIDFFSGGLLKPLTDIGRGYIASERNDQSGMNLAGMGAANYATNNRNAVFNTNVGGVTVNTNSANMKAISTDVVKSAMETSFWQANYQFANGGTL